MIVDGRGEVVWFRPMQRWRGRANDLKVQSYRGKSVLTWMDGAKEYVIFDHTYRQIARVSAGNGYYGDHHEFLISPQDTALILIYNPVRRDLSSIGGVKNDTVWQCIVQELDIESGEVLFEWHSLEHVGIDETYTAVSQDGRPGLDYFHANSIEVDHDSNLIVSARQTFAVYKIDRSTGEVMWRSGAEERLRDGSRHPICLPARRQAPTRRNDIHLRQRHHDLSRWPAGGHRRVPRHRAEARRGADERLAGREYTHPDKLHADAPATCNCLPNGNVFVGWGRALVLSEFSKDGELLFDARLPPPNRSYKSFRFHGTGTRPTDPPRSPSEPTKTSSRSTPAGTGLQRFPPGRCLPALVWTKQPQALFPETDSRLPVGTDTPPLRRRASQRPFRAGPRYYCDSEDLDPSGAG